MKKKLIALLTTIALAVTMCTPVLADTYTSDGSGTCLVTAELTSTYTITCPATLNLTDADSDGTYTGTYTVGAKGNIAGNDYVVITPSETFNMTGTTTNAVAAATVSQNVTEWVKSSPGENQIVIGSTDFSNTTGNVSVALEQADAYEGNLTFNFSLGSNVPVIAYVRLLLNGQPVGTSSTIYEMAQFCIEVIEAARPAIIKHFCIQANVASYDELIDKIMTINPELTRAEAISELEIEISEEMPTNIPSLDEIINEMTSDVGAFDGCVEFSQFILFGITPEDVAYFDVSHNYDALKTKYPLLTECAEISNQVNIEICEGSDGELAGIRDALQTKYSNTDIIVFIPYE